MARFVEFDRVMAAVLFQASARLDRAWPGGPVLEAVRQGLLCPGAAGAGRGLDSACALLVWDIRGSAFRRGPYGQLLEVGGRAVAHAVAPQDPVLDPEGAEWIPGVGLPDGVPRRLRWLYYAAALALAEVVFLGADARPALRPDHHRPLDWAADPEQLHRTAWRPVTLANGRGSNRAVDFARGLLAARAAAGVGGDADHTAIGAALSAGHVDGSLTFSRGLQRDRLRPMHGRLRLIVESALDEDLMLVELLSIVERLGLSWRAHNSLPPGPGADDGRGRPAGAPRSAMPHAPHRHPPNRRASGAARSPLDQARMLGALAAFEAFEEALDAQASGPEVLRRQIERFAADARADARRAGVDERAFAAAVRATLCGPELGDAPLARQIARGWIAPAGAIGVVARLRRRWGALALVGIAGLTAAGIALWVGRAERGAPADPAPITRGTDGAQGPAELEVLCVDLRGRGTVVPLAPGAACARGKRLVLTYSTFDAELRYARVVAIDARGRVHRIAPHEPGGRALAVEAPAARRRLPAQLALADDVAPGRLRIVARFAPTVGDLDVEGGPGYTWTGAVEVAPP